MTTGPAMQIVGFLAFAAVLGGMVYGAFSVVPGAEIVSRGLAVTLHERELNASAGKTVAFPVVVANLGTETRNFTLEAQGKIPASSTPVALKLAPGERRGVWFPFTVEANAPTGAHRFDIVARSDASLGNVYGASGTLRVLAPATGAREGDEVTVRFVGLFGDGRVFDGSLPFSNDPAYDLHAPFNPRPAPFTFVLGAPGEPLVGAGSHLLGMQPGEARAVKIPAASAFGTTTREDAFPRTSVFPTEVRTQPGVENATRKNVAAWLQQTEQAPILTLRVGDTFTWRLLTAGGAQMVPIKVKITEMGGTDESQVRWTFPDVGERFTLFSQFPNGSRILAKSAAEWTIRTEPTRAVGEAFTYASYWPNASRITSCAPACSGADYSAAKNVTITHLDDAWVGKSFVFRSSGGPVLYNVTKVDAAYVHVLSRNLHPFAGEDVTWQLRLVSVKRS